MRQVPNPRGTKECAHLVKQRRSTWKRPWDAKLQIIMEELIVRGPSLLFRCFWVWEKTISRHVLCYGIVYLFIHLPSRRGRQEGWNASWSGCLNTARQSSDKMMGENTRQMARTNQELMSPWLWWSVVRQTSRECLVVIRSSERWETALLISWSFDCADLFGDLLLLETELLCL